MSEVQDPMFYRTPAGAIAAPPERGYLIVRHPLVADLRAGHQARPPTPGAIREIKAGELASQDGCSRPHTIHCGPGGAARAAQLIAELV